MSGECDQALIHFSLTEKPTATLTSARWMKLAALPSGRSRPSQWAIISRFHGFLYQLMDSSQWIFPLGLAHLKLDRPIGFPRLEGNFNSHSAAEHLSKKCWINSWYLESFQPSLHIALYKNHLGLFRFPYVGKVPKLFSLLIEIRSYGLSPLDEPFWRLIGR